MGGLCRCVQNTNQCSDAYYYDVIRFTTCMTVHVLPQVQPKHVKEGFRLLNKSIIRVETPDINFDEDEQIINGWWCDYTRPEQSVK